ncbi:hypothetical protein D3C77_34670 [compost metagenome]
MSKRNCVDCKHSYRHRISGNRRCSLVTYTDHVNGPQPMLCGHARSDERCAPAPTIIARIKELFA